jgi:TolB protein
MRPANYRRCLLLSVIAAMSLMACKDGPLAPQEGSIRVSIETVGGDFDQDGYSLVVGSGRPVSVSPTMVIVLDYIGAGTQVLTLSGLADNCSLEGTPSRSITVPSGGTVDVKFVVTCDVTGIEITTRTTGPDQPVAPYSVKIVEPLPMIGERSGSVAANGTLLVSRLQPGSHTVSLTVDDNCSVTGGNVATVSVAHRAVTHVTFEITCVPFDRPIAFQRDTVIGGRYETSILVAGQNGVGARRIAVGFTPAWSPNGKKLAYSNAACDYYYGQPCTGGLAVLDLATLTVSVPSNAKLGVDPSWSPDGKEIAFIRIGSSDGDNTWTLTVAALDGSAARTLTPPGIIARHPSRSPDGQRIAFQVYIAPNQQYEICAMNSDGSGFVQLTHAAYNGWPAWSPDGSKIAFATGLGETSMIALMTPDGTDVTPLTKGWEPAWSPDGSKLVFAKADGLFTISSDGSNLTRLTKGPHHAPAWRP